MGTLLQDVRYAVRMLRKKPTFTIVAVLTLALGVGANTAMFSIVNAVLLRSLPYREPDRLVRIFFNKPGVGLRDVQFSVPEFDDLKSRAGIFEDVSTVGGGSVNLTGGSQPERLELAVTHPNFFSMLGTNPQVGRLFGPQDFALGFAPVVVISDGLWRRSFGADPNVLGRSLALDSDPYTIVGVLPTWISLSRSNGFRKRRRILHRGIQCRPCAHAGAQHPHYASCHRTFEAGHNAAASAGTPHRHGDAIAP
jgi:hypothetical protein